MSVPIPVRRQISAQCGGCPCHSGMPLVVPGPCLASVGDIVSGRTRDPASFRSAWGHIVPGRTRDPVSSQEIEQTGCAGLRLIFGSGPALRDVRDGYGRSSPGLWPLADGDFHTGVSRSLAVGAMVDSPLAPRVVVLLGKRLAGRLFFATCAKPTDWLLSTCSLWLDILRFLCEAASNSTTEGWLRDRALGAIVVSPGGKAGSGRTLSTARGEGRHRGDARLGLIVGAPRPGW